MVFKILNLHIVRDLMKGPKVLLFLILLSLSEAIYQKRAYGQSENLYQRSIDSRLYLKKGDKKMINITKNISTKNKSTKIKTINCIVKRQKKDIDTKILKRNRELQLLIEVQEESKSFLEFQNLVLECQVDLTKEGKEIKKEKIEILVRIKTYYKKHFINTPSKLKTFSGVDFKVPTCLRNVITKDLSSNLSQTEVPYKLIDPTIKKETYELTKTENMDSVYGLNSWEEGFLVLSEGQKGSSVMTSITFYEHNEKEIKLKEERLYKDIYILETFPIQNSNALVAFGKRETSFVLKIINPKEVESEIVLNKKVKKCKVLNGKDNSIISCIFEDESLFIFEIEKEIMNLRKVFETDVKMIAEKLSESLSAQAKIIDIELQKAEENWSVLISDEVQKETHFIVFKKNWNALILEKTITKKTTNIVGACFTQQTILFIGLDGTDLITFFASSNEEQIDLIDQGAPPKFTQVTITCYEQLNSAVIHGPEEKKRARFLAILVHGISYIHTKVVKEALSQPTLTFLYESFTSVYLKKNGEVGITWAGNNNNKQKPPKAGYGGWKFPLLGLVVKPGKKGIYQLGGGGLDSVEEIEVDVKEIEDPKAKQIKDLAKKDFKKNSRKLNEYIKIEGPVKSLTFEGGEKLNIEPRIGKPESLELKGEIDSTIYFHDKILRINKKEIEICEIENWTSLSCLPDSKTRCEIGMENFCKLKTFLKGEKEGTSGALFELEDNLKLALITRDNKFGKKNLI